MHNTKEIPVVFCCVSVKHFLFCQQYNKLCFLVLKLLWRCRSGKQNDLICNSGYFIPLSYMFLVLLTALSLLFPSLFVVRMLCLPTISVLRCTQEELSHESHAHSFVRHAAPPDNTLRIRGRGSGTQ